MRFDKIMKLMGQFDTEGKERFQEALGSFLAEILQHTPFNLEDSERDIETLQEKLGNNIFSPLLMSSVEFFLSNEYPADFGFWNAIDFLLNKKGLLLSSEDKSYLKGLRDSYMNLYEITDLKIDEGLTLRDFIEKKQAPITVKEKMGTRSLSQWDLIGARVVDTPQGKILAGGLLVLSRKRAQKAKESIDKISKVMMQKKHLRLFEKETKDPILLIKKMWTKEILEHWLTEKIKEAQEPTFLNYDGDKLQFYTLEFPLKVSLSDVVQKLNSLPELISHDVEGTLDAWIWPLRDQKKHRQQKKKTDLDAPKEIMVDSQLCNEQGETCRFFAELKIQKKKLMIDVNSEERANFMENFVQNHLASFVEKPIRLKHDLKIRQEGTTPTKKVSSGLSREQEGTLKQKFYDQHYKGWIDSSLPILKGKTPRQAVKIKTERQKVIDLLKDLINNELHNAKKEGRTTPYNFDWLFAELGIEKDLL
ncbi:MAG TPA: hypothetical protein PLY23_02225 [Alphaproteobacteria bacterium]|nr:MAG: hypothetical protein B7X84_02135 [Alphaproteobacteria bacterium 17-39-52]HQS83714.1 hypothetical protein [Alphaproteobacteria bacterium]HQS93483.1 hypothetical protein [Alphaproteobacteria bacterium]